MSFRVIQNILCPKCKKQQLIRNSYQELICWNCLWVDEDKKYEEANAEHLYTGTDNIL